MGPDLLLPKSCWQDQTLLKIPFQVINENTKLSDDPNQVRQNTTEETFRKKYSEWFTSFYNKYQRYPEPIRENLIYTRNIIIEVLETAVLVGGCRFSGVFFVLFATLNYLESFNRCHISLLNWVTQNAYDDELLRWNTQEKMATVARYELFTQLSINADGDSDEDALKLYMEKLYPEDFIKYQTGLQTFDGRSEATSKIEEEFKACIQIRIITSMKKNIYGLEHMYFAFKAFYNAIIKPFPSACGDILTSVLLRLAQAILMLPMLIHEATTQLLNMVFTKMFELFLSNVQLLICVLIIFLSNLPIYIYDGIQAVKNWASCVPEASEAPKLNP